MATMPLAFFVFCFFFWSTLHFETSSLALSLLPFSLHLFESLNYASVNFHCRLANLVCKLHSQPECNNLQFNFRHVNKMTEIEA